MTKQKWEPGVIGQAKKIVFRSVILTSKSITEAGGKNLHYEQGMRRCAQLNLANVFQVIINENTRDKKCQNHHKFTVI